MAEAPDFTAIAEATGTRLRALGDAIYPCYEAARDAGDDDRAAALDDALTRIDRLSIAANRQVIAYLDQAEDVAVACAAIDAVNGKLDAASTSCEATAADLDKITKALTQLTTLIGAVKD